MPIGKTNETTKAFPVYKYGVNGAHHVLMEGSTFPPEKGSSMVQSLGPMTTLICYLRSEARYEDKWKRSCKRAMSHIPMIDESSQLSKVKNPLNVLQSSAHLLTYF
jgi:hypothetical protein